MTFLTRLSLILTLTTPAWADEVPANLQGGLTMSVATFSDALKSGNLAATFDFMPPKVLDLLARQSGMSVEDVLSATKAQIDAAMERVTFESFGMDIAGADWQVTPDGAMGFALIPTEAVMAVEGNGRMKAMSNTLAFQGEDGSWYLVRIDDATQVSLLQAAYPEFTGVDFPVGSVEVIE